MNYSRRELYAMGEPLGDSTTTAKLGGGYVCGGGGSRSSSTQQTFNTDQRVVTESGIGVSGDSNAISVNTTTADPGIVARALQTVDINNATNADGFTKLLNAAAINNATNADGFTQLLDAATQMFNRSEGLIGQTQAAVADAYTVAQNTAKGTIDNRTITVLAVAGVAALWAINRKK